VVATRVKRLGLRIRPGEDVPLINPQDDPRFRTYWQTYHGLMERKGVSPEAAREIVRTRSTVIAALAVKLGDADAMICGTTGRYKRHLDHVTGVIGKASETRDCSAISLVILPSGSYFIVDTYVTADPTAEELAEMTVLASHHVSRFGLQPKVALLSHSNFGSGDTSSARKMRRALEILHRQHPDLEVEGEMHADAALSESIRAHIFPNSKLKGAANLLVMPTLDAANIAFNMVKASGGGLSVGPILIGTAAPAHVLTPSVSARGIVNMSAIAVADAQDRTVEE
ncbi:MAG TPA: NADP-dependent malic enzyme, partial [Kiloniellaceae bacterium]|nr:NADP-dependent malic enzyme [Kiloniellaceae bacterium]